jgi:hypothetical protein
MTFEFPHKPPKGYSYEFESLKRNVISIWIRNHYRFDYNNGVSVRSIWGFYNTKTKQYHAPINSKTVGSVVPISSTRPYTAMQINQTPLEAAFK